jgi:hypothetical protein
MERAIPKRAFADLKGHGFSRAVTLRHHDGFSH